MKQVTVHSMQLVMAIAMLTLSKSSTCNQDLYNISEVIIPSVTFDTLEDFARSSLQYFESHSNTSTKVILLQGNHTLTSQLAISDLSGEFSLVSEENRTAIICESGVALDFENIAKVMIENITFVGCVGNNFWSVKSVFIQYCTFISPGKSGSMLVFNNSIANIAESSLIGCKEQTQDCFAKTSTYLLTFKASNVSLHAITITSNHNGALSAVGGGIEMVDGLLTNGSDTFSRALINSSLTNRSNAFTRGLIKIRKTDIVISKTTITNTKQRMIISARHSNINITKSCFFNNTGELYFGMTNASLNNINITNNTGRFSLIYVFNSFLRATSIIISNNSRAFLIRHSNVKLYGQNMIANNVVKYRKSKVNSFQAESIITSISSTVIFHGKTLLIENHSQKSGGAIHDSGSSIMIYDDLMITNNKASEQGGGVYFYLTDLVCYGNCTVSGNNATEGGGIYAVSTTISLRPGRRLRKQTTLMIDNNNASKGGGLYFEVNSRINGLDGGDTNYRYMISFINNTAMEKGGAIFIDDETYSGTCESTSFTNYQTKSECFLQTYENDYDMNDKDTTTLQHHMYFANNTAERGSMLYGGLLDRCTLNLVTDVNRHRGRYKLLDGLSYFMNESGVSINEGIASDPVRICFCRSDKDTSDVDCTRSYKPPRINVTVPKGEEFTIDIVVVDQVGNPINASVAAFVSVGDTLAEGEQRQNSSINCTTLTCAVSSHNKWSTLSLYADNGPCLNKGLSRGSVKIQFSECKCPVGFQNSTEDPTKCKCVCHEKLQQCMSECKNGILRRKKNCWINYDNERHNYIIYPYCPYDYCKEPSNSSIDLRQPNGADSQCAHGRYGFLCAACRPGFSLSMGTTHCIQCSTYWRAILFSNLLAGAFFGILTVIVIFGFNMTVASGTINGLIFHANIVLALHRSLLPFTKPNFFTLFISILNSELRIERCFYAGMDAYAKAWLSLLPPLYLIVLVLIITGVGKYSSKFAYLMGKRNPVAILATLILLSYTTFIQKIISVFLSITITYSDGSHEKFWQADPRIKYFQGKHIPLFLVMLLITVIGLAYTFLLFSWQWLVRAPDKKMFQWIRNTKLNSFLDAYLAPYNQKYRFWTGLLLFCRIVVYLLITIYEGDKQQYDLFVAGIIIAIIIIAKASLGDRLYKMSGLDYTECAFYLNLLIFILASYFTLNYSTAFREKVSKISISVTLILFLAILCYHSHLILRSTKWYGTLKQKFNSPEILQRKSYAFTFSRNSVRSKTTKTEVGLSDAITESMSEEEKESSTSGNSTRKNYFNVLRQNRFEMSSRSYNSLLLRESLLI